MSKQIKSKCCGAEVKMMTVPFREMDSDLIFRCSKCYKPCEINPAEIQPEIPCAFLCRELPECDACLKAGCKHKPEKESWEEEFERLFWLHRVPKYTKQSKDIINHFRTKKIEWEKAEREKVIKEIENGCTGNTRSNHD